MEGVLMIRKLNSWVAHKWIGRGLLALLVCMMTKPHLALAHDSYNDCSERNSVPSFRFAGRIQMTMALFLVDSSRLMHLLPEGLELAERSDVPAGTHLMSFLIADQSLDYLIVNSTPLTVSPGEVSHRFQISFKVRRIGETQQFSFHTRSLLDSDVERYLSRAYGVSNRRGVFNANTANIGTVKSRYGEELVSVIVAPVAVYDASTFSNHLDQMKGSLGGKAISKMNGQWICTESEYDFNGSVAHPVTSQWKISSNLDSQLAGSFNAVGIDSNLLGGFSMLAKRTRQGPVPCGP